MKAVEGNLSTTPEGSASNGLGRAMIAWMQFRPQMPTLPEAGASLLRTVVIALFALTFIVQPFLIPSESMEHTLLVGDFLFFNKQVYAPPGLWSRIMPYGDVRRGDIVVFHHSNPPLLVKRVIGIPGDHLRIENGRVLVNGVPLSEPYAAYSRRRPTPSAIIFRRASTPIPRSIPTGGS